MATITHTHTSGRAALGTLQAAQATQVRFSDIPAIVAVPVGGGEDGHEEEVEVSLSDLSDDATELCTLLENEGARKKIWMIIASAYAKQGKTDIAIEILARGLQVLAKISPKDRAALSTLQCWLYLSKSRQASRVEPEGVPVSEARTKTFWLHQATGAVNEASRVNPSFPPLIMARGVLSLLRVSLQPPPKIVGPGQVDQSERMEILRQAQKCFEDVLRMSSGRNLMALTGKARTQYSLGKFADALISYQEVLEKAPDMYEPDPRIGIGCCLWQLNHFEEAKEAWERALEVNPESKIANILLGLYHLRDSSKHDPLSPEFAISYGTAMSKYAQRAYEFDGDHPLTCVTMGGYFLSKLALRTVESLARRAIDLADANSVISDGWYLLARREHYKQDQANLKKLIDLYGRADAARGGGARGYLLAKFGAAQAQIMQKDVEGARFRLEGIVQHHQNVMEAKLVLGTIYAQEYLDAQAAGSREDKSDALKRAISHLEAVRFTWRDEKRQSRHDPNTLILLSRLYATELPDKALGCLQQLEQLELDKAPTGLKFADEEDESARRLKQREQLAPELLNNIACFQYQLERYNEASETFQAALSACTNMSSDSSSKTDELVTTISYNLARSYEGSRLPEEARKVYDSLLERHPEYIDARARFALLEFQADPGEEGQRAMRDLFDSDPSDLEIRALYAWFLRRSKKRAANLADEPEHKHLKYTLQNFDKHDVYSLVAMGNQFITLAREMRRDTEEDRSRRHRQYQKGVEFFHKVLDLDPKNAYAAQGIAIALAEDKRDIAGAKRIFSNVRETLRDANVLINLGHTDYELKQFAKSIESYEAAMAKDRQDDTQLIACLGRTWLKRANTEKSTSAMNTALEYSQRALSIAPSQIHFRYNVAFVQHQRAQLLNTLAANQRTVSELEEAMKGVDTANVVFAEIAKAEHPPYPRYDLEQRANFGNTIKNQLERAIQEQSKYETANAERLAAAREARDQQLQEREDARRKAEEEQAEKRRKLQEERQQLVEVSRKMAEERAEAERRREEAEFTENSDGERVKKQKKKSSRAKGDGKRRRRDDETGEEDTGDEDGTDERKTRRKTRRSTSPASEGDTAPRKKRKLARKSEAGARAAKYKSSEFIEDSDDDDVATSGGKDAFDAGASDEEEAAQTPPSTRGPNSDVDMPDVDMNAAAVSPRPRVNAEEGAEDTEEDVDVVRAAPRKIQRRIDEDEDEDENEGVDMKIADPERPGNASQPATGTWEEAEDDS